MDCMISHGVPYKLPTSKVINNFVVFQLGWLCSAYFHDYRALLINIGIIFWLYLVEPWSKRRIKLTLQFVAIGLIVDSILYYLGILYFSGASISIPLWLISLWVIFSASLTVSLSWLMENKYYAMIGGAIFGPVAYWSGQQFEAIMFVDTYAYIILSLSWLFMMWSFSSLYKKQPNNLVTLHREKSK